MSRVEANKGVFAIVDMARILEQERPSSVRFDLRGGGSALQELNAVIQQQRLEHVVRAHSRLIRPELLKFYYGCHAVLTPIRSNFCEGLPRYVQRRCSAVDPFITSLLSNAHEVLSGALAVAKPEMSAASSTQSKKRWTTFLLRTTVRWLCLEQIRERAFAIT